MTVGGNKSTQMIMDSAQNWKTNLQECVLHEMQCVEATKFLTKAPEAAKVCVLIGAVSCIVNALEF